MRWLYMLSPVYLFVYNESEFLTEVCTFCDTVGCIVLFCKHLGFFGVKEVFLHCLLLEISYVDGTLL